MQKRHGNVNYGIQDNEIATVEKAECDGTQELTEAISIGQWNSRRINQDSMDRLKGSRWVETMGSSY